MPDYSFDTVVELASLFPTFLDERGHCSYRRWLPSFPGPLARSSERFSELRTSLYRGIATCTAERSFDVEATTGEPCTLIINQPAWSQQPKRLGESYKGSNGQVIWKLPPFTSPLPADSRIILGSLSIS